MKRLICALAFAAFAHPATAGTFSAYACGDYDPSRTLAVEVDDDSEQMEKIRSAVVDALRGRSVPVSPGGGWVLAIRTEAIREGVRRKERDLGSVNDGSSENVNVRMNVWSNRQDSLIGGRKTDVIAGPIDEVSVAITINDKSNGKCVWRGDARHDSTGRDQWDIAERSALVLIRNMGKAVRDREFNVD